MSAEEGERFLYQMFVDFPLLGGIEDRIAKMQLIRQLVRFKVGLLWEKYMAAIADLLNMQSARLVWWPFA